MIIHHVCIQTDCYQESLAFYKDVIGMSVVKETKSFHGRDFNTWLELDGFMIELQTAKQNVELTEYSNNQKGLVHFSFYSDDIITSLENILIKGYDRFKLKDGKRLYEVEGGKLYKVIAPEGTIIEVRDSKKL